MSAVTLANAMTTTGVGPSVAIRKPNTIRTYQVSVTGTLSFIIEASNDGKNFVPLSTAITATAGYEDSSPWQWVRVNVSANTGSLTVVLGERD